MSRMILVSGVIYCPETTSDQWSFNLKLTDASVVIVVFISVRCRLRTRLARTFADSNHETLQTEPLSAISLFTEMEQDLMQTLTDSTESDENSSTLITRRLNAV